MTVAELIEKLKAMPQDARIELVCYGMGKAYNPFIYLHRRDREQFVRIADED